MPAPKINTVEAWIPLRHLSTGHKTTKIESYGSLLLMWRHPCSKTTKANCLFTWKWWKKISFRLFLQDRGLIMQHSLSWGGLLWLRQPRQHIEYPTVFMGGGRTLQGILRLQNEAWEVKCVSEHLQKSSPLSFFLPRLTKIPCSADMTQNPALCRKQTH